MIKLSFLGYLELLAALLLVTSTWLQAKEKIIAWCIAIISILFNIFILYSFTLYAQCITNFVELVISIYGWYVWNKRHTQQKVTILRIPIQKLLYLLAIAVLCSIFLQNMAIAFHLTLNAWDPYYIVFVCIADWCIIKKKIEGWILWIFLDFFGVILFYYKGFYIYTLLHCIYVICSFYGFFAWKKYISS